MRRIQYAILYALPLAVISGSIGRFALGPVLHPDGSHIDGYENLERLGVGIVSAAVGFVIGGIIGFFRTPTEQ